MALRVRPEAGRLSLIDSEHREVALVVPDWEAGKALVVRCNDDALEEVRQIISQYWPTLTFTTQQEAR